MPNITCGGPGPHLPASGILGTSDKAQTADVRCESSSCVKPVDPSVVVQTSLQTKAAAALASNTTAITTLQGYIANQAGTTTNVALKQIAQIMVTVLRENNALIRLTQGLLDTDDA